MPAPYRIRNVLTGKCIQFDNLTKNRMRITVRLWGYSFDLIYRQNDVGIAQPSLITHEPAVRCNE